MRRAPITLVILLAALASGCGGKYMLPKERPAARPVPSDKSYAMLATWRNMDGIQDVLLTQGPGSQLFMVFNHYPTDTPDSLSPSHGGYPPTTAYGDVRLYPFAAPNPIGAPYFYPPRTLFNPISVAVAQGRMFVLDQGDTCEAKWDDVRGTCRPDPTPQPLNRRSIVRDYLATWRVREFTSGGGDTISTFTDTTFAIVNGIAADDAGHVYVSGIAVVLDTSTVDQHFRTRKYASRVYRYARGPRYTGLVPDSLNRDLHMPGASWHRDTTWLAFDGTGASSVSDPRGITWMRVNGLPTLTIADRGNNQVKSISPELVLVPYVRFDGRDSYIQFNAPEDVAQDYQGYYYAVDRGNRRVVRYDPQGNYVQDVNVEANSDSLPLLDPVSIGVDDSLAYVGDRGRGQVIRYKRRP